MLDIFSFSHQEFFVGHDIMLIFPGCRDLRQCEGRAPTGAAEGNVSLLTQEIVMWYIPNTTSWKTFGNDMERNTANKNVRQHSGKKLGTPNTQALLRVRRRTNISCAAVKTNHVLAVLGQSHAPSNSCLPKLDHKMHGPTHHILPWLQLTCVLWWHTLYLLIFT